MLSKQERDLVPFQHFLTKYHKNAACAECQGEERAKEQNPIHAEVGSSGSLSMLQ